MGNDTCNSMLWKISLNERLYQHPSTNNGHITSIDSETRWTPFCRRHIQNHFHECKLLYFKYIIETCSLWFNWQHGRIISDDGSTLKSSKSVWLHDYSYMPHWRIYTSVGFNELKHSLLMSVTACCLFGAMPFATNVIRLGLWAHIPSVLTYVWNGVKELLTLVFGCWTGGCNS